MSCARNFIYKVNQLDLQTGIIYQTTLPAPQGNYTTVALQPTNAGADYLSALMSISEDVHYDAYESLAFEESCDSPHLDRWGPAEHALCCCKDRAVRGQMKMMHAIFGAAFGQWLEHCI